MRDNAERLTGPPVIIKDSKAFFRRGTSGAGREELSAALAATRGGWPSWPRRTCSAGCTGTAHAGAGP